MGVPAVSVIIPFYNAEKYLAECLKSILLQTFQDFEVIIVDDCSTDKNVAIVESYKEKFGGRLRLARTETNSGSGCIPRNIGLNLARGEYVFFADADHFILLTAQETLYLTAKEHDADVVYTSACYDLRKPNDVRVSWDDKGKAALKKHVDDRAGADSRRTRRKSAKTFFRKRFSQRVGKIRSARPLDGKRNSLPVYRYRRRVHLEHKPLLSREKIFASAEAAVLLSQLFRRTHCSK